MTEQELVNIWTLGINDIAPYIGTPKYVRGLHDIVNKLKDCPRKDDLKLSVICKYIDHYIEMWERKHNKEFNRNDILKIRIPKWIKDIYNG